MTASTKHKEAKGQAKHDATPSKVIRPLGDMENFHAALHSLELLRGNTLTCRYGIPSPVQDLTKLVETFDLAVARATLDHPLLQVGMIGEDSKKPAWIRLDSMDMTYHVQWREIDDLMEPDVAVENFLRVELDVRTEHQDTRPGWRIVVLHRAAPQFFDAVLIWNHSAFDGMSAKLFHDCILRYLNTPMGTQERPPLHDGVLKLPSSYPQFPPAQHKMAKYSASPGFMCSEMWKEWGPQSVVSKDVPRIDWAPIRPLPIQTGLLTLSIDNKALQNVVAACRKNKTTVAGLINGLLAFAFAEQLSQAEAPSIHAQVAANMRRWTPAHPPKYAWLEPDKTIANILTNVSFDFDSTLMAKVRSRCQAPLTGRERMEDLADVVWELAVLARNDVDKALSPGRKNSRVALMKYVPDWREQHRAAWKKPRQVSWILSNLGVIDGSPGAAEQDASSGDAAPWTIRSSVFAVSQVPNGSVLEVTAVAVKGGDLTVGVSYHEPAVSDKFVQQVVNNLREWLNFLGGQ